jgi:hypothetical protein
MPQLLGGFDRVGLHALDIDAADLGVPGDHRLQTETPSSTALLHHVVQPLVLKRREQAVQVARRGLRPRLFLQRELDVLPATR